MAADRNENVAFRRIRGRIVPIRIGPEQMKARLSPTLAPVVNVNFVRGGAAPVAGLSYNGAGVRNYSRGRYKTKNERRNEQRRERYAIRKQLQMQKKEDDRWGSVDLFGSKYLNTRTVGMAVLGGSAAAFGVWGGARLIGKRAARMSNWRKLSGTMTRLGLGREKALRTAGNLKKDAASFAAAGDIFSAAAAGDLTKKATKSEKLASRIAQRMQNIQSRTHYSQKKKIVDWWSKHQSKVLLGTGAATAGSLYYRESRK